jgi:hypothetical protein
MEQAGAIRAALHAAMPGDQALLNRALEDMAVKRNYGSFSKACGRYFAPMISHLGFEPLGGASFARDRDGYRDGLFFEQSPWGSGEFCMTIGFHVPALDALLRREPAFSLMLGRRVSDAGVDGGECWLGAQDRDELVASLRSFAGYLEGCMHYVDEVRCIADLVSAHARQEGLGEAPPDQVTHLEQLGVANHGLLLVLAGDVENGRRWIETSVASMKAEGITQYTASRVAELDALMDRIRAGAL